MEKRKCKVCGDTFFTNRSTQKYCSKECYAEARKKKCADRYRKIKAQKKAERAKEKKKNKNKEVHIGELAAFNDKAKQMGLTYGQYMIFLQTKKDREERKNAKQNIKKVQVC